MMTRLPTIFRFNGIAPCALAAIAFAFASGCDTIVSDFRSMGDVLTPPSPQEAAQWAVDTTDAENMRRGVALLGTSSFGGVDAYVKLYRFYVKDMRDPLVQAAAIAALARFGNPEDAVLISQRLLSSFAHVRLAAALGLQRLHNASVTEAMWRKLEDESEEQETRVELAIALGQYPQDDVFQALVAALDHSELTVNLAALDSLRMMTGNDLGISRARWLSWYWTTPVENRFVAENVYLYPTYQRHMVFWDYVVFWDIPKWESPSIPTGLNDGGARGTYEAPIVPAVQAPTG
ncbi:MAG: HEAT repeat domain-containing protein [Phycisphaerales bacterium]|nr:HEAT repeat domain-containing protein [Phycisphaerales bacterium]